MGALRSSSTKVCGWPPGFGSSEQRGAQVRGAHLCYRQRHTSFSANGVAAVRGGGSASANPRLTSTPKQKPFLRHGA
ncbi:hypothetical protein [Pectobacterium fontis]|uniref:Uncharacterized protein n=1 Tax=Pectobacterium fontis TaxID=2558042 RepID=A0A7V8IGA6_9GAMM|nr:hypothetical protein [Pectobacterium fontis]KHN49684.1 hypothetical protein OI69_17370 [Pectobacterium fontis]